MPDFRPGDNDYPELTSGPYLTYGTGTHGSIGLDLFVPAAKRNIVIAAAFWEEGAGDAAAFVGKLDTTSSGLASVSGLLEGSPRLRYAVYQFADLVTGNVGAGLHRVSFEPSGASKVTNPVMVAMAFGAAASGTPSALNPIPQTTPTIPVGELFLGMHHAYGAASAKIGGALRPIFHSGALPNGMGTLEIAYFYGVGNATFVSPTAPGVVAQVFPYIRLPYVAS